jgi:hypothetical protein
LSPVWHSAQCLRRIGTTSCAKSTGAAPSITFFDYMGRSLRSLGINGNGEAVLQDSNYDSMGRAFRKSNPYRLGQSTPYWTQTVSFDLLNRPILVRTPDDAIAAGYVETGYAYAGSGSGATVTTTDAKGRVSELFKDGNGRTLVVYQNKPRFRS